MREQNFQLGKIDSNVIDIDGIAVFVACAREDGRASVEHDGHSVSFRGAINDLELFHASKVIVRKEQLVRGMDLDHANAELQDLLDIGEDVG